MGEKASKASQEIKEKNRIIANSVGMASFTDASISVSADGIAVTALRVG